MKDPINISAKILEPPNSAGFGIFMSFIFSTLITIGFLIIISSGIQDNKWAENSVTINCTIKGHVYAEYSELKNGIRKYRCSLDLNLDCDEKNYTAYASPCSEESKYPINSTITAFYNPISNPNIKLHINKFNLLQGFIIYLLFMLFFVGICLASLHPCCRKK